MAKIRTLNPCSAFGYEVIVACRSDIAVAGVQLPLPVFASMRSESHRRGAVAEQRAIAFLLEEGYSVSIPVAEERYDLIVEHKGVSLRVQVKRGFWTVQEDMVERRLEAYLRTITRDKEGSKHKEYTKKDIDGVLVYNPEHEEFYYLSIDECPSYRAARKLETWREDLASGKIRAVLR